MQLNLKKAWNKWGWYRQVKEEERPAGQEWSQEDLACPNMNRLKEQPEIRVRWRQMDNHQLGLAKVELYKEELQLHNATNVTHK